MDGTAVPKRTERQGGRAAILRASVAKIPSAPYLRVTASVRSSMLTRRTLLLALAAPALPAIARATEAPPAAGALPRVLVHKDPSCGCCRAWADHLKAAGFPVEIAESSAMNRIKARLGVPEAVASCHTAEVGGYVIEGHVPADAVKALLAERPRARGLAVPGMPVGSPGMEVAGVEPETYEVVLFGDGEPRTIARYRGVTRLEA